MYAGRPADGVIGVQVGRCAADRAPQPCNESIIARAAAINGAAAHPAGRQGRDELGAAELRTLVRGKALKHRESCQHLPQCVEAAVRCHRIGTPPGEDLAGQPVDDGREVREAPSPRDVRQVGCAGLVRLTDAEAAQQVGEDAMLGRRPTRAIRAINCLECHAAHERRDGLSADLSALERERVAQNPCGGERWFQMRFIEPSHRAHMQIRNWLRGVAHTRARQAQQQGLSSDQQPMGAIHQRIPLGPCSLPRAQANNPVSGVCWPIPACSSLRFRPRLLRGTSQGEELCGTREKLVFPPPGLVRLDIDGRGPLREDRIASECRLGHPRHPEQSNLMIRLSGLRRRCHARARPGSIARPEQYDVRHLAGARVSRADSKENGNVQNLRRSAYEI